MNPIALINVNSGGLEGSIGFPIDNPSEKYLDGTGNWSTIQVPSSGGGGSGSRTRNIITVSSQSDITGATYISNVNSIQHVPGTDTIMLFDCGANLIQMAFPEDGDQGDKITLLFNKRTVGTMLLYPSLSTTALIRTLWDTNLTYQKNYTEKYEFTGFAGNQALDFYKINSYWYGAVVIT